MEVKNYQQDKEFLQQYTTLCALTDGQREVLVAPALQGRVLTSTYDTKSGSSFGWLNYKLFQSQEKQAHINAYGGEERFWLGPEGGQYSIYFKQGTDFIFDNWQVPKELDTEPFQLVKQTDKAVSFVQQMEVQNYLGTELSIQVNRDIKILSQMTIEQELGISLAGIAATAYQTDNKLTNIANEQWTEKTGLLNIWLLGMFKPSTNNKIIIPIHNKLGITTDYFGHIPTQRLQIYPSHITMSADGKYRSKIGIAPQSATDYAAAYNAEENELTIIKHKKIKGKALYLDAKWELKSNPFSGDIINAYNDGCLENGQQMGPFYELETSSHTANLNSGESIMHTQQTFHLKGMNIKAIAEKILGIKPLI